jgi:formylglycine-generating enzyme required for sulfatase activity
MGRTDAATQCAETPALDASCEAATAATCVHGDTVWSCLAGSWVSLGTPDDYSAPSSRDQPEFAATVADFRLDKFEVTVGRFRRFVQVYDGQPPPAGAGAHPLIEGSGWNSAWDQRIPSSQTALKEELACHATLQTWSDTSDSNETYPINCVSWYLAFFFCAWDGGRLATEAEWEYAAAGGDENSLFPWGSDTPVPVPAHYDDDQTPFDSFAPVGSHPNGNARWGQSDLAGNLWEWLLDVYLSAYPSECNNCANLGGNTQRVARGGGLTTMGTGVDFLRAAFRNWEDPEDFADRIGIRCARSAD